MKKIVIGIVCFVAILFLLRLSEYFQAKHQSSLVCAWLGVQTAALRLQTDGSFTNNYPTIYRLFGYTNRYLISGSFYQCVVAADSWDYRDHNNLLAFTTNGVCLFIDRPRSHQTK